VLVWFGLIHLIMHSAIFGMVQADLSAAWVWGVHIAGFVAIWAVLWLYMARRFRQLLAGERYSMMIAVGQILAHAGLAFAVIPPSIDASAREALALYPGLTAVSGLALFVVGATHWSRFLAIGVVVMALTPVMSCWPDAAPLIYGIAAAACMWYWGYAKKVIFAVPPATDGARG
jgi:hypothetical protein